MRVFPLHRDSDSDYSCICYWILGDHNEAYDRNTLIDTGSSNMANLGYFMREMTVQSKGIGKMAVEQVILTHNHFDHAGGLAGIIRQFDPKTYAWIPSAGKYEAIHDGMGLMVGDQEAVLLHSPGHSDDSTCVFLPGAHALFSGDTLYRITDNKGSYSRSYVATLDRLATLDIRTIYPGHGTIIQDGAMAYLRACIANVSRSHIEDA